MLMEGEQLGIVTLTNSQTRGVPEGINSAFFDIATHGEQTVDWLGAYGKIFADMDGNSPGEKWAATPAAAAAPLPLDAYVGTYDNSYYGPLTVSADGGGLSMSMGPPDAPTTFVLSPFDGDVFTFDTIDNIAGKSGATFSMGPDGTATSVNLAFYDLSGLGGRWRDQDEFARPPDALAPVARMADEDEKPEEEQTLRRLDYRRPPNPPPDAGTWR